MKKFKLNFNTKKLAFLLWALSAILSFIVAELFNTNNIFTINFFRILLNILIIVFLNLFIYSITGKIKLSAILSTMIIFVLSLSNYVIYCFRGTPLDPLDILSLGTGISVAASYSLAVTFYLIFAILLFAVTIFVCFKIKYNPRFNKKVIIVRIALFISTIILVFVLFNTGLINSLNLYTNLWKPKVEYNTNGFIASFVKQTISSVQKAPENYSEEILEEITKNYISSEEELDNTSSESTIKPHIIAIMNESFSDLNVHRELNTNEDFMPYFRNFSKSTIHGYTHSSTFGGKTPNVEWEFLTNNSMAFFAYGIVPYQQYISKPSYSLVSTLEDQGYTTYAVHPYYGSGYRRTSVYPLFGFDHFYSYENLKDELELIREYASDLSTYKEVIKLFEQKEEDELFFNFTVTMQNHSGYDFEGFTPTITLTDLPNCPRAEQYLSVIKESDKALEYLINYFNNVDEPVIILMYGDHQPPYLEQDFWDYLNANKTDSLEDAETRLFNPIFYLGKL